MSIIFNGAGYVEFPGLGISVSDSTGWTILVKLKYEGNAGEALESLCHLFDTGGAYNMARMYITNTAAGTAHWEQDRINFKSFDSGWNIANFTPLTALTFSSNEDAVYFVRRLGSEIRTGRCYKSGNVVAESGNVPAGSGGTTFNKKTILGAYNGTADFMKNGREMLEFGIVNRALSDAEIQQYAGGAAFKSVVGSDLLAYAPLNEGTGTSTTLQKAGGATVVGTLKGGLTWGAVVPQPVSFSGTVQTQNATVNAPTNIALSSYYSGNQTPFTYAVVEGSLTGTGLSLNSSTGLISGAPSAIGSISSLRVSATDSAGNTATSNAFNINVAAPALPAGTVSIGTVTVGQTTATIPFAYNAADQSGFEYQLSNGAITAVPSGTSPIALTGLSGSTNYSIKVRAVNATGAGDWSNVVNFKTQAVPQVPQGTFAFGTLDISSNQVVIPYTYSGSDQTSIQYRVGNGSARSATSSPQTIIGLSPSTAYNVEFRAVNANGNGAWSTPVSFTTSAAAVGTITLTDLVNNAGQPLASVSNVTVDVISRSTGALVVRRTALTTTAGADLTISDPAIVAGTAYNAVIGIGDAVGVAKVTAL